jgi:hypothetical protein
MFRAAAVSCLVSILAACGDDTSQQGGGTGGSTTNDASSGGADSGLDAGDAGDATTGGASGSAGAGGDAGDGGIPICKAYPSTLTFPNNQAAVEAALLKFAPNANMTWNSTHGTIQIVTNLGVPLDCAGNGNDVWAAAWAFLMSHPDVFQLDQSEWAVSSPYPCSAVNDKSLVNTGRTKLAGVNVAKDVIAISVEPDGNGGVMLSTFSGFYLPVLDPSQIQDCEDLPDATLENLVRQKSYPFSTFSQCVPTGSGTYVPQPNDIIEWGDTWWTWDDGTGVVIATKSRGGRLIISEANWTPQLMASDLNCPKEVGDGRILGYTLTVDPITGEVFAMPGIGCIVC